MRAFISYSHKDTDLLSKFHEHLSALQRQKLLQTWTDREIHAGGVIDRHVEEQLEGADLYLLLVSSAFIQSDYCFEKEFIKALERQNAGKAHIVPIIIRECDWKIDQLRQFKALPEDGKPVLSRHWHSLDEGFANVTAGLRALIEKMGSNTNEIQASKAAPSKKEKFTPDDRHVSESQRHDLGDLAKEIVLRLTAKDAKKSAEEFKKAQGRSFGTVWSQFNEHFGIKDHGLQSLPKEKFDEAKNWLRQYRASKDKNLKRNNPQKYRNSLTKAIYSVIGELKWSKEELYVFASEKVGYAQPITSLDDLGVNQLELVRDRVRYEQKKEKIKAAQSKARRK